MAEPLRALVVGDRFIRADLFAGALDAAAEQAGLPLVTERLQLPYPAVDAVPLPTTAADAPPRPLWEDPAVAAERAAADFAADPTIREYSGPVDLLAPYVAGGGGARAPPGAAFTRRDRRRQPFAGGRLRPRRRGQPQPGEPQRARYPGLLLSRP